MSWMSELFDLISASLQAAQYAQEGRFDKAMQIMRSI
jgi:hypothetical protein